MEIYKYPDVSGIYAIKHKGKIYNILDNAKYDTNSFLTGGIIITSKNKDTTKIEFPYDILMDGYDKGYTKDESANIIYDSNLWDGSKINEINAKIISQEFSKPPEPNITKSLIYNIQTIQKEVDKIKELYKDDDEVFKQQWFMNYVELDITKKSFLPKFVSEYIPPEVSKLSTKVSTKVNEKLSEQLPNVLKTREENITNSIRTIYNLSKTFEINNNHQMKLFFEIFFNSTAECKPK